MIRTVGVIYQDAGSLGFLRGLEKRLRCDADLVAHPTAIGKTQRLPRQQTRQAWRFFSKKGVDAVVRFTDADRRPWSDVRRNELANVPSEVQSLWICAVAVNNMEDWLCLDPKYLALQLQLRESALANPQNRTGIIKRAISQQGQNRESPSDVVERIVVSAPPSVFRTWLRDDSLRAFYVECRNAAKRAGCDTPNEVDDGGTSD